MRTRRLHSTLLPLLILAWFNVCTAWKPTYIGKCSDLNDLEAQAIPCKFPGENDYGVLQYYSCWPRVLALAAHEVNTDGYFLLDVETCALVNLHCDELAERVEFLEGTCVPFETAKVVVSDIVAEAKAAAEKVDDLEEMEGMIMIAGGVAAFFVALSAVWWTWQAVAFARRRGCCGGPGNATVAPSECSEA